MRLKNTQCANLSVYSCKKRNQCMTVPGQSVLELDDKVWLDEYEGEAKALVEAGHLVVLLAPKKTDEQVAKEEAKALADAKALIAKAEAASKKPATAGK